MKTINYPTLKKSNKEHKCDFCGQVIEKGTKYYSATYSNPDVYSWKTHKYCMDISSELKMYDDCDEGVTSEDFKENITVEYQRILSEEFNEVYESKAFIYPSFDKQLLFVLNHHKIVENATDR